MSTGRPEETTSSIVAVVENVRSLWNVGSMFRSADGAGLARILLCGFTPHPPRKEITKTALGAEERVDWEFWSSAAQACEHLRELGYQIVALETGPGSQDLEEVELRPPVAFVVGNEVEGIRESTLRVCDAHASLPMHGHKASLNVAVAFGIAAYSLRRRCPDGAPST